MEQDTDVMCAFMIIGKLDTPLFEADLSNVINREPPATSGGAGGNNPSVKGSSRGSTSSAPTNVSTAPKKRHGADTAHITKFLFFTALDHLEGSTWTTTNVMMRPFESIGSLSISSLVSPSHTKFLLLHKSGGGRATEDSIKTFLQGAQELYAKALLSPFTEINRPVVSAIFEEKIFALAKRVLVLPVN